MSNEWPKACTWCRGEFGVGSPQGYDTATSGLSQEEDGDPALSDSPPISSKALQLAADAMDSTQRSLGGAQDPPSTGPGQATPAGVHQAAAGGRDPLALAARQRGSRRLAAQAAGAEQAGTRSRPVAEQEAEPCAGHAHPTERPAGFRSAGNTAEPSAEQLGNGHAEEAGMQGAPKLRVHTSSQSASQAGSRPVQAAPMRRSSSHHDLAQQDAAVMRASPGTDAALRPDKSSTGGVEQAGGGWRPGPLCHGTAE